MSDFAREWSDAQLEELTARFNKAYSQAAEDMRLKLEVSLGRYAKENEARQKAMDDTPEARKAYEEWKRGQIADQNWLQGMVQNLSESATNANQHAMDMLNDAIPRIYAENANMAAFLVDNQLGYDTGFTLVSEDAVRYLMGLPDQEVGYDQLIREVTWTPEAARSHVQDLRKREVDYPKDMHWNRQKFSSAITQGILQGESIPNIVRRTKSIYGMNKNSATRAARTATTNAENAGRMSSFERAQRLGIDMEIEWLATADGRTRSSHRALDGERVMVGEKFSNGLRWPSDPLGAPSEVWNCFVGDTKAVPLGELQRSFRRFYDGDAVTVITASGVNFTCTPNHPILTSKGWVAAGLLDDSYDLFVADLGNGLDGSGIKPDIKHVGTSLEAIHELVSMRLGNRASSLGVYFHEDVLTCNVDVVTEERSLRVNPETLRLEPIDEIGLELPDTLASSDGPEMKFVGTPMTPPDSLVGSGSEPRALLGSGIRHALEHGLRTVSGRDSSPLEPDVYDVSTDSEVLGESLHALSAVVKLDHVVNVDVHPISTHVYNLQTESGAYLASSSDNRQAYIIAHNCRCRATGNVVGFDGKRGDWANEKGERWTRLPKGMTYEEWKKAKPVSREKSYENPSNIVTGFWPDRKQEQQRHTFAEGRNIAAEWTPSGEYKYDVQEILKTQGFDGKPLIVDSDEFEEYAKSAKDGGLIMQRAYGAPTQEVLDAYREALYGGEFYVDCYGGHMYGRGMYASYADGTEPTKFMQKTSEKYAKSHGAKVGYVETMTMDKSAKIITYDALMDYWEDESIPASLREGDDGALAASLGFDAIMVENAGEIVVLNRTKLIIRRPE